jgi:hypothetical protein
VVVCTSFVNYTSNTAWLVMPKPRCPNAAFDYLEGFEFTTNSDPVNGVCEQRHVPAAVAEIVMNSVGLHRHLLHLVCFHATSGKRLLIYSYMPSGSVVVMADASSSTNSAVA